MRKRRKTNNQPTVAPGIDNDAELHEKASKKDIERGEFTEVTMLTTEDINNREEG